MAFARFMSSPFGRIARIVAGAVIIVLGVATQSLWAIPIIAVGGVFIVAGVANVCFISPLIRAPFRGRDAVAK